MGLFGNSIKQPVAPTAQATQQPPRWADALTAIGAIMADVGGGQGPQYSMQLAAAKQKAAQEAQQQAQMQQLAQTAGGDDPILRALFMIDPKGAAAAMADRYKVQKLSQGDTAFNLPGQQGPYVAPVMRFEGDQAITQGPGGIQITGRRDPSFAENTGRMNADEGIRHNKESEKLGYGNLAVSQGQLGVSRMNAGTSAGQLGLGRERLNYEKFGNAIPVRSPADLAALPPGSRYVGPDGVLREKP